jgi:membrane protein implicated in regulation of membrane protease activity
VLARLPRGWAVVLTHKAAGARRLGVRAGVGSLCGRIGVVRRWSDSVGQVFLDGTLWRARDRGGEDGAEALHEGDSVVVEHVNGLTLSVRRAEEWELIA